MGSGSTLYVCNFPPTADEAWIREKFAKVSQVNPDLFCIQETDGYGSTEKLLTYVFHH